LVVGHDGANSVAIFRRYRSFSISMVLGADEAPKGLKQKMWWVLFFAGPLQRQKGGREKMNCRGNIYATH
jgi:hypothetical protein